MVDYEIQVDEANTRRWFRNGKLHRDDGPAVEYADGRRSWFVDGLELTEYDFLYMCTFKEDRS